MFRISSGFGEMEPSRRDRREGWGQGKIGERWKGSGSGGWGGGMATEGKEGSWVVGGQGEREREKTGSDPRPFLLASGKGRLDLLTARHITMVAV